MSLGFLRRKIIYYWSALHLYRGRHYLQRMLDNQVSCILDMKRRVLAGLGMLRRMIIHYWSALHPYKGKHSL